MSTRVTGLTNGATFTFVVAAKNTAGWGPNSTASSAAYPTRPNIVFVLTDDQRWDSLGQMPVTNGRTWRRFSRSFVNEPQCCPSRASTLTGRYPHHTGVATLTTGAKLDERTTIATMLHGVGYSTALIGKYLNGYPFGRGFYTPPGWDEFRAFVGGITYFNYALAENGVLTSYGVDSASYATDLLTTKGVAFIRGTPMTRPLFLMLTPNAPHNQGSLGPMVPAPRDKGSCANVSFALPASFNAYDTVSEPAWMTGETPVSSLWSFNYRRLTCETLGAVDDSVTALLKELWLRQRLDNTYFVLSSDNGYAMGEHRLTGKGDLYETSIRVPLLVRGPGVVAGTDQGLTSNVDLAPTFAAWARAAPPADFFDGHSFAARAAGTPGATSPSAVLLRGCRTGPSTDHACGKYRTDMGTNWGVRTQRYKYIEYPDGYRQLFDLSTDPNELTNLGLSSSYASVRNYLHNTLVSLRGF